MEAHSWGEVWGWAKANGLAGLLGAASVKLWEWVAGAWKHRLSPMERLVLVLALENGGSMKWDENREGGAPLIGYRVAFFALNGTEIVPSIRNEEFADQGEMCALIAKGYMEAADGGYLRRLTTAGFGRARSLRATFEKKGIAALKQLGGEHIEELRGHYLAAPWWRFRLRWSMPQIETEPAVSKTRKK